MLSETRPAVQHNRISLSSLFLFFVLAVLICPGQQPATGPLPKNDLVIPNSTGVLIPPVPNAPFSATVEIFSEQKLPDGSVNLLRTINHIARDSQGRTYNEHRRFVATSFEDEPPILNFRIYDPVTSLSTSLDPYTFIARQMVLKAPPPLESSGATPSGTSAPPDPSIKQEDLGTRTLENLLLKGTRKSRDRGIIDEYWYSSDLSIYVIRKHEDPKWRQTITVTHIERAEPQAAKFLVPKGYRIVDGSPTPQVSQEPGQPPTYRPGNGVSAPQVTYSANPEYTDEARRAKFQGMCVVSLIVDANGMPQNVHVVRPLGKGLDEKAVEAVKKYRFKPAMYEGHAVAVEVNVEVNFRLF
jgi:TonB family protein